LSDISNFYAEGLTNVCYQSAKKKEKMIIQVNPNFLTSDSTPDLEVRLERACEEA